MRIVIPPTLRSHMLSLIHQSHFGIIKCKQLAREVMYWPGMNSQFSSFEFRDFCKDLDIAHVTSSPHFQISNGAAKRAVQTVKRLMRKSDKQLELLNHTIRECKSVHISTSRGKEVIKYSIGNVWHFAPKKSKSKPYKAEFTIDQGQAES